MARLSVELNRFFFEDPSRGKVTLADILILAGERTFGFLFVLLALPSALPVPAPGYSVPFGIVMLLLALQLIAGRKRPWMPNSWQSKAFEIQQLQGFLKKGLPWLQRLESLSRPRMAYICTSLPGRVVLGSAIALMSISMMIPIPGTNTLPAIGIFVTGFGLLDDDGFISISGLTICVLGLILTSLILIFGYEGVKLGIDYLRNAF